MSYKDLFQKVLEGTIDDLSEPLSPSEIEALIDHSKTDAGAPFEPDVVARLRATKKASPAVYMRLREKLKETKKVKVGDLDKLIDKAEKAEGEAGVGQGRPIVFPEIEPWDVAVDGSEILTDLIRQVRRYVMTAEASAIAIALWIIHAFCFECWSHSPRLAIISPEKRCGKTTLLNLVQAMVPRALSASNITAAAMFRTIEKYRPSLLIDEADTFLKDNEELRGVINAGHSKSGSILRLVGEDHEPAAFSTFCPTAIAAIGKLPGTIEDRSIKIVMRRRLKEEVVERFISSKLQHLDELKRKIARWVDDNQSKLVDADPEMPETLNDRACDNWRGMLAIADLIGADWPAKARQAAAEISGDEDDQSRGVMLLGDIQTVFRLRASDRISSTELSVALCLLEDRPWATWSRGKQISPATVARMLKEFHISPTTIKSSDGKQPNGYKLAQFVDAFQRYLSERSSSVPEGSPCSPSIDNSMGYVVIPGSPDTDGGGTQKEDQGIDIIGVGEVGKFAEPSIEVNDISWLDAVPPDRMKTMLDLIGCNLYVP